MTAILCRTVEEFIHGLQQAVNLKRDLSTLEDFASKARWQNRLEQLLSALELSSERGAVK